jgi:RNA polymerase sigma factor (sigma-70 family)
MHGLPQTDLVREYFWIVEKFSAQYRAAAPNADLRSAGALGLVEAAARFQPKRGLRFSTYAWNWVKGAVLAELRKSHVVPVAEWTARQDASQGRSPRVLVVFGAFDEDEAAPVSERAEQEDDADRCMRLRGIREAAQHLEDPSHRVVIEGTLDGKTPEQIGENMGLGDERVRQLLREAQALLTSDLWDETMEERMADDELSASDIALIQDPSFYRTAQPLVQRLAVAVLEARALAEREEPKPEMVEANEKVLEAHEKVWELEKALADCKKTMERQRDRVATLEVTLRTERDRSKAARAAAFDRVHAAEVRGLLRQAMKALKP